MNTKTKRSLTPRLDAMMTKTEAYGAGLYEFSPPPVSTGNWSKRDWLAAVTFTVPTKPEVCAKCGDTLGDDWRKSPFCRKCRRPKGEL